MHLWWVLEIEGAVETEIDEPHQARVELSKGDHDTEIDVTRHLQTQWEGQASTRNQLGNETWIERVLT